MTCSMFLQNKTFYVEICQREDSILSKEKIEELAKTELFTQDKYKLFDIIYGINSSNIDVKTHIESILCTCSEIEFVQKNIHDYESEDFKYYVYRLTDENAAIETMQSESGELAAASHWILPAREFHYLWENLFYNKDVKENLWHFVETAMIFADRNVNPQIINWNKVVLLHGPPGTGKTSLCKALAQKLSIRLGNRFTRGELVEINSHSLFSKWFSESGKLVMKMFEEIRNFLNDPEALVCLLIDEIESLAHVRKSNSNGTEPTDSVRVVNALLTQLDQIKSYPNLLILTTSNLTEAIDLAFVDRADIKQYIGYPEKQAIYKIYYSCIKELMRTNLLEEEDIYDYGYLKMTGYVSNSDTENSIRLFELCEQSKGLSGRALRKLPFLAYASFIRSGKCPLTRFMRAMSFSIEKQREESLEWVQ